jgi:hypothetical protein
MFSIFLETSAFIHNKEGVTVSMFDKNLDIVYSLDLFIQNISEPDIFLATSLFFQRTLLLPPVPTPSLHRSQTVANSLRKVV